MKLNLQQFIDKVAESKKDNKLDLSSDEDLVFGIMNLISIEEHLAFTGAKTQKNHYFEVVKEVRELRKNLMLRVVKNKDGEIWCTLKHLLSSSMRMMEVATKQQTMGNQKLAEEFFQKSYDLYVLFWSLNLNLIESTDLPKEELKEIKNLEAKESSSSEITSPLLSKKATPMQKLRTMVTKLINCCRE